MQLQQLQRGDSLGVVAQLQGARVCGAEGGGHIGPSVLLLQQWQQHSSAPQYQCMDRQRLA